MTGQGPPARMSTGFGSTDRRALGVHAVLMIYAGETVSHPRKEHIHLFAWESNLAQQGRIVLSSSRPRAGGDSHLKAHSPTQLVGLVLVARIPPPAPPWQAPHKAVPRD